jgi:hypothetical protein
MDFDSFIHFYKIFITDIFDLNYKEGKHLFI